MEIGPRGALRNDSFYEELIAVFYDGDGVGKTYADLVVLLMENIDTVIDALEQAEPPKSDLERLVEVVQKKFPGQKLIIEN